MQIRLQARGAKNVKLFRGLLMRVKGSSANSVLPVNLLLSILRKKRIFKSENFLIVKLRDKIFNNTEKTGSA